MVESNLLSELLSEALARRLRNGRLNDLEAFRIKVREIFEDEPKDVETIKAKLIDFIQDYERKYGYRGY